MVLALNILLSILSVGILAGRVYEILNVTDAATGFLTSTGIVFNPYILVIYLVITICCGIIIFENSKKSAPFFSKSDGLFAIISGVSLIVASVMNLQGSKLSLFAIVGGIAFVLLGVFGLNNDIKDKIIMLLMLVFVIGMCFDVIIFNVSTVYNINFLKNVLSYITIISFILFVFKNMYAPSKYSRMVLYITGYMSFIFCTIMYIADIMASFAKGTFEIPNLIWNLAFVFIGFYGFATALSVASESKKLSDIKESALKSESDNNLDYLLKNINPVEIKDKNEDILSGKDLENFFKMEEIKENTIKYRKNEDSSEQTETSKIVYKRPK